jgi:hypothetical protein
MNLTKHELRASKAHRSSLQLPFTMTKMNETLCLVLLSKTQCGNFRSREELLRGKLVVETLVNLTYKSALLWDVHSAANNILNLTVTLKDASVLK